MPSGIDSVLRYLQGLGNEKKARGAPRPRAEPFITISRQAGAGGRSLAQALMRRLEARRGGRLFENWHVFDRELCQKVGEDRSLQVSLESLLNEEFRNPLEDALFRMFALETPQSRVHGRIFKTVRDLAGAGKAIIVGRGGACLTRGLARGIHVRLVAPRPFRVRRAAARFGVSAAEAERWVDSQDRHRARLVRKYFRKDIEDPLLYDCVWNAETSPLEAIAEALVLMIETKAVEAEGLEASPARG